MSPENPEPLSPTGADPLIIVVDANVFARRAWMEPLLAAAEAGYVRLIWSPAIIAEASRVLQWIWLQKRGDEMTEALKREAFDIARRWFRHMTAVFEVVEDRPPYASHWTDNSQDEDDRPIWTAAVRADAFIVVTENLKDGPPANAAGLQVWDRVTYVHPTLLTQFLAVWSHEFTVGDLPEDIVASASMSADLGPLVQHLHPDHLAVLRAAEIRTQTELPRDPSSSDR